MAILDKIADGCGQTTRWTDDMQTDTNTHANQQINRRVDRGVEADRQQGRQTQTNIDRQDREMYSLSLQRGLVAMCVCGLVVVCVCAREGVQMKASWCRECKWLGYC